MFTGIFIMAIMLAGFVVLLRQAGSARHPLLQRLREKGIRPGRTELLLCRRPSFVSAGQLMTEREQRFLRRLDRVTDTRYWQLFRLVSQWHCDVVITDRTGRIIVAVGLDDRSHQVQKRQRRDLLLEDVLKQAGIP
ncbi:DUF2726 domain-containing protein, partial [Salmonella enterica]|nr:DUF2726 domain-containing protein [Salmonella enterica]